MFKFQGFSLTLFNMYSQNLSPSVPGAQIFLGSFRFSSHQKIAKGYSSCVYSGINTETNETVAIKAVNLKTLKTGLMKSLLDNQIEAMTQLSSCPHIVNCYEIKTEGNFAYFITEFCSEGDLEKKIKEKELSEEQILGIMVQILEGYLEISKKRYVHRDIKPSNILLNKNNQIKIGDFGFCTKQQEKTKKYQYNVGSLPFLAPEALLENVYSAKTDIWAIGVTIYQMLTKKTPWRGKSHKQLMSIYTQPISPEIFEKLQCNHIISDFLKRSIVFKEEDRIGISELESFITRLKQVQGIKLSRQYSQKVSNEQDCLSQINTDIFTPRD